MGDDILGGMSYIFVTEYACRFLMEDLWNTHMAPLIQEYKVGFKRSIPQFVWNALSV